MEGIGRLRLVGGAAEFGEQQSRDPAGEATAAFHSQIITMQFQDGS